MTKTLHVYPVKGFWKVAKEGYALKTFPTQGEAVADAVKLAKKSKAGQVVVFGNRGKVTDRRVFGLVKIQDPPKKGKLAPKKIADAVSQVTLNRLKAYGEQAIPA